MDLMQKIEHHEHELLEEIKAKGGFTLKNISMYNQLCEFKENIMKHMPQPTNPMQGY